VSPRPRTVSDEQILIATARAIGRHGPADLTLAHVAQDLGISPATLVQRFGSKRRLLLALAETGVAGVEQCFSAARGAARSPRATVISALASIANTVGRPEEIANHLAFLQMDLTDRDFHRLALAHARATTRHIETLLRDAIAARELVRCDTRQLARTLQALMSGSLLAWAILREGKGEAWLRRDLEAAVAPYRAHKIKNAPATTRVRRAERTARSTSG